MEIVKKTDTQFFFKASPPKALLCLYWSVLISLKVFVVVLDFVYGAGTLLFLIILIGFDIMLLRETLTRHSVAIDLVKGSLEVTENNNTLYSYTGPIHQIVCVKTVFGSRIGPFSSLVLVFSDGREEIVDSAYAGQYDIPFFIDLRVNMQAEIGNAMAEFLGIPYKDGEYRQI